MERRFYTLTRRAEKDLSDIADWSLVRWGSDLTDDHLEALHKGVEWIAKNQRKITTRPELALGSGLSIYLIREHYVVFLPVAKEHVIVVAFLRQGRDIPTILRKNSSRFARDLKYIEQKIENGEIVV